MESKSSSLQQTTDAKQHVRKIRTAKDLLDITVEGQDTDLEEMTSDCDVVAFRLKGIFPPVTDQRAVSLNEAERQYNASAVRELKFRNHTSQPSLSAEQLSGPVDGGVKINRNNTVRPTKGSTVWLACLNAVAADYRHAANEDKLAEKRALVQQIRDSRNIGRETATAELERRKSWSNFVEKAEHQAVSSALNQRAAFDFETAQSYRNARRRSRALEANRRCDVKFAGDIARQVGACAKANVQFTEGEMREISAQRALETVSQQHGSEVDRRNATNQAIVERQQLLQLRVKTAQEDIKRTLSSQSDYRRAAVKKRFVSLKHDRASAAAASRSKTLLLLPIISTPQ
jgi:hypothetical protein